MNCDQKIIWRQVVVAYLQLICIGFQALTKFITEFQDNFNNNEQIVV
jgi:hypothetical protein